MTGTLGQNPWRRRAILAGGVLAVVGWVKGAPLLLSLTTDGAEFRPIPGLNPFRELITGGSISASGIAFLGLSDENATSPALKRLEQTVRDDPCRALFGDAQQGLLPVAVFSDFRCPNCRVMDARLAEIEAEMPGTFRIIRHELPIFGAASVTASRAVLAADLQGGYDAMYARLIRTPAVTDRAYIASLAANIGLDGPRVVSDMASPAVDLRLMKSRAIANVFGFIGTPAFAVGQIVFLGAIPKSRFVNLLTKEKGFMCPAV